MYDLKSVTITDNGDMNFEEDKKKIRRKVTEEQGRRFAEQEGLIFLGETSCFDENNNVLDLY